MPLGVALSELRYELRAEIYSSLLPAHGLSAVDMQNALLARTQRELWNLYAWPHLDYHIDFDLPANTQYVDFDPTMPFENVLGLWRNYKPEPAAVDSIALRLRGLDQRAAGLVSADPVAQRGHRRRGERAHRVHRPGADLADPDASSRTCAGMGKRRSIRSRSTPTSA